ncbi:vesicle transport through interaction with t-SNAREs homolog 1A-like [Glossina fuscipes]|uniref:Vesicle transport through interaction with t-SNAREs homolog 1A-like n=1 Tax=Glossina fuscipes TaxID=7396 RepID=A0A9C6DXL9_9MUSC|nr:vesicle transport through interaction with t-SNAREs homolog 1A-like [Glossina fuscipes]
MTLKIIRTSALVSSNYQKPKFKLNCAQVELKRLQNEYKKARDDTSRSRLRETNAELGRASRTLNSTWMRAMRQKVVLYTVGGCFVVAVVVSIYLTYSSNARKA